MLRIPHCLDNRLTDGGEVVNLTHRQWFTPQKHYLCIQLIGSRTRDLPAWGIVPQLTTLSSFNPAEEQSNKSFGQETDPWLGFERRTLTWEWKRNDPRSLFYTLCSSLGQQRNPRGLIRPDEAICQPLESTAYPALRSCVFVFIICLNSCLRHKFCIRNLSVVIFCPVISFYSTQAILITVLIRSIITSLVASSILPQRVITCFTSDSGNWRSVLMRAVCDAHTGCAPCSLVCSKQTAWNRVFEKLTVIVRSHDLPLHSEGTSSRNAF
jgi:hypothetical protein